jgi:hypothetical protein
MMTVHLKKDLNIRKSALKRNIDNFLDIAHEGDERIKTAVDAHFMLNRPTQKYTPTEALELISWYITSHDECVWDNEEDYNPLQVYAANKKMEKYESAVNFIDQLKSK